MGRAAASIMAELPTVGRSVTLALAAQRLEAMSSGPAFKLSPLSVQASLRYICRVANALLLGVSMDERPETTSTLVRQALAQFAFFMEVEVEATEEEAAKTVRGPQAYALLFKRASQNHVDKKSIAAHDFERLMLFKNLVSPEDAADLLELIT